MAVPSVVVTGAAAGIGRAISARVVAGGWTVIGVDVDAGTLADTARALGDRFVPVHGDVSSADTHTSAASAATGSGRRLVGWVNNAAVEIPGSAHDVVEADLRRVLEVDLLGVALGLSAAVRAFLAAGSGGSIVNLSSIQAVAGFDGSFAYQAAKGGVEALTRQVAVEYAARGIRCNSVLPGAVDTPMTDATAALGTDPEAERARYAALHPMGRMARPEEVAQAVWFLLTDASSFVTGTGLRVDGGATARCSPVTVGVVGSDPAADAPDST
jgi:NAD(P)-dependent dehydrogenase (short-subunit alcohol dehydrogenase family)